MDISDEQFNTLDTLYSKDNDICKFKKLEKLLNPFNLTITGINKSVIIGFSDINRKNLIKNLLKFILGIFIYFFIIAFSLQFNFQKIDLNDWPLSSKNSDYSKYYTLENYRKIALKFNEIIEVSKIYKSIFSPRFYRHHREPN